VTIVRHEGTLQLETGVAPVLVCWTWTVPIRRDAEKGGIGADQLHKFVAELLKFCSFEWGIILRTICAMKCLVLALFNE
jgi:hypothetical protein